MSGLYPTIGTDGTVSLLLRRFNGPKFEKLETYMIDALVHELRTVQPGSDKESGRTNTTFNWKQLTYGRQQRKINEDAMTKTKIIHTQSITNCWQSFTQAIDTIQALLWLQSTRCTKLSVWLYDLVGGPQHSKSSRSLAKCSSSLL